MRMSVGTKTCSILDGELQGGANLASETTKRKTEIKTDIHGKLYMGPIGSISGGKGNSNPSTTHINFKRKSFRKKSPARDTRRRNFQFSSRGIGQPY